MRRGRAVVIAGAIVGCLWIHEDKPREPDRASSSAMEFMVVSVTNFVSSLVLSEEFLQSFHTARTCDGVTNSRFKYVRELEFASTNGDLEGCLSNTVSSFSVLFVLFFKFLCKGGCEFFACFMHHQAHGNGCISSFQQVEEPKAPSTSFVGRLLFPITVTSMDQQGLATERFDHQIPWFLVVFRFACAHPAARLLKRDWNIKIEPVNMEVLPSRLTGTSSFQCIFPIPYAFAAKIPSPFWPFFAPRRGC